MRTRCAVLCLFGSVLFTAAGCGGGSGTGGGGGGGNNQPTTVTVNIHGAAPAAIATQIGADPFTAQPATSSTVTLSVPSGTTNFAVAYACPAVVEGSGALQSSAVTEDVFEASTQDGTSFTLNCTPAPISVQIGKLTGSIDASAVPGANYLAVAADNGTSGQENLFSGSSANFSASLPSGTDRVSVEAYNYTAGNQFGANSVWTLAAARNFSGVTVPGSLNGGNTVALDASDAVTMQSITYQNIPSGYQQPTAFAEYVWSGGGGFMLSNGLTNQFPVVPASAAQFGDSYEFLVNARSSTNIGESVAVNTYTTSSAPLTINLPSPWTYAGPSPAAWPVFTLAYNGFAGQSNVINGASMTWEATSSSTVFLFVDSTAHHQGASTSLAIPDLTSLPGFAAAPPAGVTVVWSAEIAQSSFAPAQSSASAGTSAVVENSGTYTAP